MIKKLEYIILGIILLFITGCKDKLENIEDIIEEPQTIEETTKEDKIIVDIKGEIKKPGVYELENNKRVSDVIKLAGGLTENADTELINLSKTLKDEMVIIIYNKYEIEDLKNKLNQPETIIKYIEKKCECPDTTNDACIKKQLKATQEEISKDKKISINTASLEELMQVDGIGESKAKAIIKYREENGPFETIEDIKKVSGIGESTFEKFKDFITV